MKGMVVQGGRYSAHMLEIDVGLEPFSVGIVGARDALIVGVLGFSIGCRLPAFGLRIQSRFMPAMHRHMTDILRWRRSAATLSRMVLTSQ